MARAAERARLARELADLQARSGAGEDMGLVGTSPAMVALRDLIRRIAPTRLPALILGPSGTARNSSPAPFTISHRAPASGW